MDLDRLVIPPQIGQKGFLLLGEIKLYLTLHRPLELRAGGVDCALFSGSHHAQGGKDSEPRAHPQPVRIAQHLC